MIFRVYIADALMAISARDQKMSRRYSDILKDAFDSTVPKETEAQVKTRITDKLNIFLGKGEEEIGSNDTESDFGP